MSERIVSDPSQHGWVDLGNGKWGWAGEGSGGGCVWTDNGDGSIEYGGTVVYDDNRMAVPHVLGVGDFDGYAPSGGTIVARGDGGSTKIACKNKQYDAEAGINLETGNTHKWRIANHGLTQKLIFTTGSVTPTEGTGQVTINTDGAVDAASFTVNGQPLSGGSHELVAEAVPGTDGSGAIHRATNQQSWGLKFGGAVASARLVSQLSDGPSMYQYGPSLVFHHYYGDPNNGAMITARKADGNLGVSLGYANGGEFKGGYFSGNLYAANVATRNSYVVTIKDLIDAFQTLRDATNNERDVDGIRTAISDCVGGLIQKWEAMQSEFDAEVAAEKAKIDKTIDPNWERNNA